ncbi:MAG TPA: alpha/beta hydrolase [Geminicoccus sp.]|jgi:pimeloyl-ACP methyl ester carboxylesterase|uniref:alpha/beta fold hydrolase n=1 Tax=Geminicoccus sp. TaxID=2024832 RepID=UPI002E339E56|nr:alpha/beta hydrolase [Geminicoccus sp.]HEX2525370.1 alpha/beta hydrolase [Geminicoccus sp.]
MKLRQNEKENPPMPIRRFVLPSGVTLSAIDEGQGRPLVMIPGWSQTAATFKHNIPFLAQHRRVLALDMRGHGESDKPMGGYRVARLAADLAEVLDQLDLQDGVDLLGHSMGSSVIWSYLDLFGPARLRRLVIVDQAPMATALPGWSEEDRQRYAAFLPDPNATAALCARVRDATDPASLREILHGMFTPAFPAADLDWIVQENLKFPRGFAADLLFDHCLNDWRDIIEQIRLPTLVIGGRASFFHWSSQEWIASRNPNARAVIFSEAEGGAHFMFYENPERFNQELSSFLGTD